MSALQHHIYQEIKLIADNPTIENYRALLKYFPYTKYFRNSVITAVSSTFLSVVVSTFAAYSFSRFRYKGRNILSFLILATQMFPLIAAIIPLYLVFSKLDLIDTHYALIIAYVAFTIPFCTWMLKGFFDSIPIELEESAKIDGATGLQILFRIVLPLALPAIAATTVFSFVISWNEFLYATVFTISEHARTLPAAIGLLMGQGYTEWGMLSAAGVFTTIPVVLLFVFLKKYLIKGLTAGALKG